ncbi:Uncharacterized protein SCF082_LOCUS33491 [Durusdinium trenchii]|uniref:DUF7869 domain-containing protein n=1 Tax=Durusdinium trenchii TaxID=1381693 RepID=A0ABP0NPH6_9DINO
MELTKVAKLNLKDFANQVRYSCDYIDACKKFNQKPGRFLNPLAGEFFSGLPSGWTSANAGAVNKEKFFKQFPDMQPNANQVEKSDYCRKILQLRMDEGRFLYFENVKAILGKKQSMRSLFNYIVQALRVEPLASLLEKSSVWNELNKVPQHLWLSEEQPCDHNERMGVLGNLVVPACARLGACVALGMAISNDSSLDNNCALIVAQIAFCSDVLHSTGILLMICLKKVFDEVKAVEKDREESGKSTWRQAAPVDLRYLKLRKYDQPRSVELTSDVVTFLQKVYCSVAETLPDVRDDTLSDGECEVWAANFSFLRFRQASSHSVCAECFKHKQLISALSRHLSARRTQEGLYHQHLEDHFRDRVTYWESRGESRARHSSISIIIDGMDQGKFAIPRHKSAHTKALANFSRPRLHVTGAIAHGYFVSMYVTDSDVPKDSNTSLEIISHSLDLLSKYTDLTRTDITIQCDNTPREIKNNHTLRYCAGAVSCGSVRSIKVCSLRSGHSHEDIDQVFGQCASFLKTVRSRLTPDDFVDSLREFVQDVLCRPFEKDRHVWKLDTVREWSLGIW